MWIEIVLLRITYITSKRYFILQFIIITLLAILPFSNIYVWRNIINYLSDINENGIGFLITNIGIYIALYIVTELLSRANEYVMYKYNDRVNVFVENIIVDKCVDVDLSFYDSSELNDRLSYSTSIIYSMVGISSVIFYIIRFGINFAFSAVLLTSLNIWYVFLILVFCIPVFINNMIIDLSDIKFSEENTNINRRMRYFKDLFRNVDNEFDIRLFGLRDFFLGKYSAAWQDWYKKRKN